MRSWFWTTLLLTLSLSAIACDDKAGDDDDSAGASDGISGELVISLTGYAATCSAAYTFQGPETAGQWCADCTYTWDTYFTLVTQTGECDFTDMDSAIGYFPGYYGGFDAVVYEYGGGYYYYGAGTMEGGVVSWGYAYYDYTAYGYGYYDFSLGGAGTLY